MYGCDPNDQSTWSEPALLQCHVGKNATQGIKKENMRGSVDRRRKAKGASEATEKQEEKYPPTDDMFEAIQRTFQGRSSCELIHCHVYNANTLA